MIDWSVHPKWQSFQLNIFKSESCRVGFGIVSDSEITDAELQDWMELYCKFQLAHVFHNPVIIFPIQQPAILGAPLFNAAPNTPILYNIPPTAYADLSTTVEDAPFLISDKAITEIENFQGIMGSIYESLTTLHREKGLIVVGFYKPEVYDLETIENASELETNSV